jgi:hypothetical protein
LTATEGSDTVVILSGRAATVMVNARDCVWGVLSLSWTVAVKLAVPLVVGVPEITPVEGARVRPAGRLPEVMDQV